MSVLTPFADMAPVPRVLVEVQPAEFPAGAVTVSLMRTAEGRTFAVRGGQRLPAGAPAVVIDAEAPFGVESSYTVMGHDAAGNLVGSMPVGSVVLACDLTVIQQPLDARLRVSVTRLDGWAPMLTRRTPGELLYSQGQSLPGLVGLGPRRGVEVVAINVLVDSWDAADMLQATLGTHGDRQLPIWLIRTPPDDRIPGVFFCHVSALEEQPWSGTANPEDVEFRASVTEVRPPAPGITSTALTHSDIKALFTTHSEVKALYATHSDIKRDTSLIGAGDA